MYYEDENNLYHYSYRKGDKVENVRDVDYTEVPNTAAKADPWEEKKPKKNRLGLKIAALASCRDLAEKVNPYLRPLHDALLDMLGPQKMASLQETGIIEVAPLAFMRGRTLNDAFIILDEAQNTTPEQMKMFLTRLGFNSKAVITGDITQIDLPDSKKSGLIEA